MWAYLNQLMNSTYHYMFKKNFFLAQIKISNTVYVFGSLIFLPFYLYSAMITAALSVAAPLAPLLLLVPAAVIFSRVAATLQCPI